MFYKKLMENFTILHKEKGIAVEKGKMTRKPVLFDRAEHNFSLAHIIN